MSVYHRLRLHYPTNRSNIAVTTAIPTPTIDTRPCIEETTKRTVNR